MKAISGGITSHSDRVHVNICIDGGTNHTRAYPNTISSAIDRLEIINRAIQSISLDAITNDAFLVKELIHLFQEAHIDILPGSGLYQQIHNAQVLIAYLQINILEFSNQEALLLLGSGRAVDELNADCQKTLIQIKDWPLHAIQWDSQSLNDLYAQLREVFASYVKLLKTKKTQLQAEYDQMLHRINACLDTSI